MRHIRLHLYRLLAVSAFGTCALMYATTSLMPGCILDDNRCDENQVALEGDLTVCECAEGSIRDPRGYGCIACGANEEVKENKCACKEGFARTTPEAACEESMLGSDCDTDADCPSAFPYCATDRSAGGYCTTLGCSDASGCAEGWACEQAQPMNYCSRAPSGQGLPCTTSADCANYEASYCEAVMSKTCLVSNCAIGEAVCFGAYTCCNISAIAESVPSLCVPPEGIVNDQCPLNAPKVEQ
jgi:hypothetical protein